MTETYGLGGYDPTRPHDNRISRADDQSRAVTDYTVTPPRTRPYTSAENAAADARLERGARLDSIEARLARLEARLWPPAAPDAPASDAKTWAEWGGAWPAGTILADGGRVWRNVTTVPLTTPPSAFPGGPGPWTHLFVEHNPAPAGAAPWDPDATYAVDDLVADLGVTYRCLVAHGPERQGTWRPGPATPTVWAVV